MGQILRDESIGSLIRLGDNIVQLPNSLLNVGFQQYETGDLSCDITTNGVGGLDSGSPAIHTTLYFYVVAPNGAPGLIASTSSVLPSGYGIARFVGSFNINFNTVLGGLLHDSERALQPIKFLANDTNPMTFNPALANGVQSTALYSNVVEDTHLCYDVSTGAYWIPFTKSYAADGSIGITGTYSNNGSLVTAIRNLGSFGGNLVQTLRKSTASSAAFTGDSEFSHYPLVIGDQIFVAVTPNNWTSISHAGTVDQNNFSVKG